MDLNDFYELSTVALEVQELYEENRLEGRAKQTALNFVRRELYDAYQDEPDMLIQLHMGLYCCGLQKGFVDEKSKKELESLTLEDVLAVFDETDGKHIYEVLCELLKAEPVKQVRKKIDYSNPGASRWKPGDVYAYELTGKEAEEAGIKGKFGLLYVIDNIIKSKRESDVTCYLLYKKTDGIIGTVSDILNESIILPFTYLGLYRCFLNNKNHEYPTDRLIYIGNTTSIQMPNDEVIPPSSDFYRWIGWRNFEHRIVFGRNIYIEAMRRKGK